MTEREKVKGERGRGEAKRIRKEEGGRGRELDRG